MAARPQAVARCRRRDGGDPLRRRGPRGCGVHAWPVKNYLSSLLAARTKPRRLAWRVACARPQRTARRCAASTSCRSSRGSGATKAARIRRAYEAAEYALSDTLPAKTPASATKVCSVARRDTARARRGRRTRDVTPRARARDTWRLTRARETSHRTRVM